MAHSGDGRVAKLLSAGEVAEILNVSAAWVRDHANGRRRPYLPSVKLGHMVRFDPEQVRQFVEDCTRFACEKGGGR